MEIDFKRIEEIKKLYESLISKSEENIKVMIVVEILKTLGYEASTFDFEHPVYHNEKKIDFVVNVEKKKILYVETKRGDRELSESDIIQIANYMHIRSIEWGILSNGKDYILINGKIETVNQESSALEDKIALRINLFSKKDLKLLEYISKEAIFDTEITRYFKDIAQYRAYKFPLGKGSWNTYKGTIKNFFIYYAEKEKKYRPLEQIRVDDFEEFLINDQKNKSGMGKSVNSEDTFNNKYSHFRSMLIELRKNKYINSHHFEEERKRLIKKLDVKDVGKHENYLNGDSVSAMLDYMQDTDNPVRDTVIILLSLYIGLERSTLRNLTWAMFDDNMKNLKINDKKIPLPNKLSNYLLRLEKENKSKGIKGKHLFYTKYNKKYNLINETTISDIFNRLQNIDENDPKWSYFSAQYIRNCLVSKMFEHSFSIEEISYLTGMDLVNISNLISYEKICSKVNLNKDKILIKHPFQDCLVE